MKYVAACCEINAKRSRPNIAPDGSTYASYTFDLVGGILGGGILYAPNTEHSITFLYLGQELCAADALTGELLWKIKGVYTPTAIAHSVLVTSDSYNGFYIRFWQR